MRRKVYRTPAMRSFGISVKKARVERGLSQSALAAAIGMSRASIGNIETGRQDTTVTMIHRLAEALETTPALLFGDINA